MANVVVPDFRTELLKRRGRLETALATLPDKQDLQRLLRDVDSALQRLERGTFGLCETCREPVERTRLLADPLVTHCLDHLTDEQRRAFSQDLEHAARIQAALLPANNMRVGPWEACYHYEPLGSVSGDFCDLWQAGDGDAGLTFVFGDVSGKGVSAALLMSNLHAIFRTLLAAGPPLGELLERANALFCQSTMAQSFAPLVLGRAAPDGEIELINAGHHPPIVVSGAGCSPIETTGLPLGLFGSARYRAVQTRLNPGDSLFLYTDGLIEACDAAGNEYGIERLSAELTRRRSLAARELATACLHHVASFRSGAPTSDDLTLMVLRRAA